MDGESLINLLSRFSVLVIVAVVPVGRIRLWALVCVIRFITERQERRMDAETDDSRRRDASRDIVKALRRTDRGECSLSSTVSLLKNLRKITWSKNTEM